MRKIVNVPLLILWFSPIFIVLTLLLSVLYGAKEIEWNTIVHAFFSFDPNNVDHQIVRYSRLPRAIGALLIGAFLAISGAIMQGVTRNYLASPSIMGVSDGSAFAITCCMIFVPHASSMDMILYSLIGSAVAVGIVFGFASLVPNGMAPVQMAIIGTVIGTFLSSISAAMASYFQISQDISFWYNARLHQLDPQLIKWTIPFAVLGIVLALVISRKITILSLGKEVAVGLGIKTNLVKGTAAVTVVILTGISVSLVGTIGFVGLIVPHMTRFLVGMDYRWIIPCAGMIGAVFLGLADVMSRFLNHPFETPIGVVTALIGVPFFLYLIRNKGGGSHA
ncbi:iron complex transport system permease protein [Salibacterium salarium]|uniref:FecCD family ABC transporter permease n=1 Tax=Salibacterium salarium TaxID=284579 RepID=UPI00278798DB|nr:iron ABC transporter permease [Salibacterium salarium]MDQ0297934.1 iron complex transport system permease protein [Salibacterium salarium]